MSDTEKATILFECLSEAAQNQVISDDPDALYTWYAKKGEAPDEWEVQRIENHLLDLLEAQGGMKKGWLLVVWHDGY